MKKKMAVDERHTEKGEEKRGVNERAHARVAGKRERGRPEEEEVDSRTRRPASSRCAPAARAGVAAVRGAWNLLALNS